MEFLRAHFWKLVLALASVTVGWHYWSTRSVHHGDGETAPDEPVQVDGEGPSFTFKDHLVNPLATFDIRARVLSRERYWFDPSAKLSPIDFALGWGVMSDNRLLDKLSISQGGRWWRWSYGEGVMEQEVIYHAANMHMIPSTPAIEHDLLAVRVGQIVHITGKLVLVRGDNGFEWRSSLTRRDSGEHSCEVVYVESLSVADI